MTLKYRVKLKNERIVGPLILEEIGDLFLQNHLKGSEDCQVFPVGDWKKISTFPEITKYLEELANKQSASHVEETKPKTEEIKSEVKKPEVPSTIETVDEVVEKSQIRENTKTTSDTEAGFNEFKFSRELKKVDIDYKALAKKHGAPEEEEVDEDKTRIVNKKAAPKQIEKTVVVNQDWKVELELQRKKEEEEEKQAKERAQRDQDEALLKKSAIEKAASEAALIVEAEEDNSNESTQFLHLTKVLPSMNAELMQAEVELENERKVQENRARIEEERKALHISHKKIDDEKISMPPKRRKGMTPIIAIAFMAIFYVLMTPDEEVKKDLMAHMPVKFPTTLQYENAEEAKRFLTEGRTLYSENTYLKRLTASQYFGQSLSNKFNSNEALGDLILVYAENMKNTKKSTESNLVIYRLIQLAESRLLFDLNAASGTALFYNNIGKPFTAVNVVKNYIKAGSKVSTKILGYYLESLINAQDLVAAREVFEKLDKTPKKSFEVYSSMIYFTEMDNNFEKSLALLKEGLKYYPNSVVLLLKQAEYQLKENNVKDYEATLLKITNLNSEGSPYFTAKYFENMGYLSVVKKKNKEAVTFFKKSLALYENESLRTKLSKLELSGDQFAQELILESKIQELLKRAREEKEKQNWELAFSYSTEAIDANPNHVDAILLQTEMQINRGYFEQAFYSLKRILQVYPNNDSIKKNLVLAYLYSLRFSDAQKALGELSQSKFSLTDEYALLMAQYYELTNNTIQASKWYLEAIKRNALNDNAIYRLAKFYMRYKQFDNAKNRIVKAIELDPKNVAYHVLNAEIMYEKDSPEVAIGYIRDLMSENGEDPRYMSTIAIFYSRSGQIKDFEFYYKKVVSQGKRDEDFYRYMIRLNKLNDNVNDVISNTNELLKLNPGDLKTRMEFGEYLMEMKKYPEALDQFLDIKQKLSSYPRVHFNMARVYLITGDLKAAKINADKEFEMNPSLDTSLYIVGEVARLQAKYSEAIEKLEKAIAINPRSVDSLMSLGWIKLKQNFYSEAFELYNRAFREDRNNPEIHKMLGYCYKASGQRALAKEKFEDYLKLSPGASDRAEIEGLIRLLQ